MATLLSQANGNFTTASTWGLVDSTSYLNSEVNTQNTTTTFTNGSQFTPGAITIDGIAIKVNSHTLVGTVSLRLVTGGGVAGTTTGTAVSGTTVTINVLDLPTINTSAQNGWAYFKFSASVTLVAATAYNLQVQSSTASSVTLYRDATTSNASRALKTSTTQAPAAGDEILINGEYNSAGVNSTRTVTMNNTTNATVFGAIQIGGNGILSYGVAASTNYKLKTNNTLNIYTGGTLQIGSSGSPIPSTSTATLEFLNVANVDFGIEARIGSTLGSFGNAITNSALLAADASAAATSLTTNVSTNWKSGDVIALASTTRTRTEAESKALTANASGTSLTITALTNAHGGNSTTGVVAELINLTRNVQIFGTSSSLQSYINTNTSTIINLNNTEFYFLGSATANKRGIDIGTTSLGLAIIDGCSMHDFVVTGSMGATINAAGSGNITFSNNVLYNIASTGVTLAATTQNTTTISNCIVIAAAQAAAGSGYSLADLANSYSNLTATSCNGIGITFTDLTGTATNIFGTMNGFVAHSNSSIGISFNTVTGVTNNPMGTFTNISAWRNNTIGLNISNTFAITIDTVNLFGNTASNLTIGGTEIDNIYFKNVTADAGTTLTCPIGISITTDCHEVYFDSSNFGVNTTHATGDISVIINTFPRIVFRNSTLSSPTQISGATLMTEGSFISFAKLNTTPGNHKTTKKYGTIIPDTTIFNSGGTSTRMTPNNSLSNDKLQGTVRKFAVVSGQTATITVFLRKSVAGDGTAYNGNQPRLMLKADAAVGVLSDTVLATADNTYNGAWKALTAVTPAITDNAAFQIYIDCDGTTGWVNVDDWAVQ